MICDLRYVKCVLVICDVECICDMQYTILKRQLLMQVATTCLALKPWCRLYYFTVCATYVYEYHNYHHHVY